MQPELVAAARDYFVNVQQAPKRYKPLLRPEDEPASWLSKNTKRPRTTGSIVWWLIVVPLLLVVSPGRARAQDFTTGRVIEWPSTAFPTLQAAVDALNDGDVLRIAPGTFRLSEPVFVRGKRVTIEGAGCDARRRSRIHRRVPSASGRGIETADESGTSSRLRTTLVGPRPTRVADSSEAIGLFNFEAAGGTLKGVELSGFDAGIVGRDPLRPDAARRMLVVQDTCISDTARGVLWKTSTPLTMLDVWIHQTLWHGLSAAVANAQGIVNLRNVVLAEAAGACLYFSNTVAAVTAMDMVSCILGGIAAVNSSTLTTTGVNMGLLGFPFQGPGITLVQSHAFISNTDIQDASKSGILMFESTGAVINSAISQTHPDGNGSFGDGITAMLCPTVLLSSNSISSLPRAGVANFGSTMTLVLNEIDFTAFALEGEPLFGVDFTFQDLGGNVCDGGSCTYVTVGLSPPTPITPVE